MLGILVAAAGAAELHVEVDTDEGIHDTATWDATDAFSKRFGPAVVGKTSVSYVVTVMGAVWDPAKSAYQVDFGLCVEWNRKGEPGRYCKKEDHMAPATHETFSGTVKDKDKFGWKFDLWYTGDPPDLKITPLLPPIEK